MKYLVQIKQDLTACDTIARGLLNRTISEQLFDSENDALKFYESTKNGFKFAGLAGQYVTYPQSVSIDYQLFKHRCECCDVGFNESPYTDLNGDFCSKACFRNNYQDSHSYDDEPYYAEDY